MQRNNSIMESNSGILFYTKLYTLLLPPINPHLLQINNTRYDLNHIECKRKQSNENESIYIYNYSYVLVIYVNI